MGSKGLNKSSLSWIFFDFGNSAFTTVIVTAFYVLYFKKVIALDSPLGDFYWGLAVTLSMLFVSLSSPVFGAIADETSYRRGFMVIYALVCIVFTVLLSFVGPGSVLLGLAFFIIANIGYEGSEVFYNSFLPQVSSRENRGRISGWAWGLGYLGGILSLALILPFVANGFGQENMSKVKLVFWICAFQFLVFGMPAFLFLKDFPRSRGRHSLIEYAGSGLKRVFSTLREIKKLKDMFWLILAFFIYNDGIHTVIVFASAFMNDTLGFTLRENFVFLIIVNSVAFFGAVSFGYIADKIGAKRSILITLVIWVIAMTGVYFVKTKETFYLIGILVGVAMGSSQSATRTLIGLFSPKKRSAEFFGFAAIGGKVSAVMGPVLFGLISSLTGNQRYSILLVLGFFIIGFFVLLKVDEKRGIGLARSLDEEESNV